MKWLTVPAFLCSLAITAQAAPNNNLSQEPIVLPTMTLCSPILPETMLSEQFGEIPFVDGEGHILIANGQQVSGSMKMFLHPNRETFTIVLSIGEDVHCMIMTGEFLEPSDLGPDI